MSKMGNAIVDIQELAYQGIPNAEIAKYTKTSLSFVEGIVRDYLQTEDEYFDYEYDEKETLDE